MFNESIEIQTTFKESYMEKKTLHKYYVSFHAILVIKHKSKEIKHI